MGERREGERRREGGREKKEREKRGRREGGRKEREEGRGGRGEEAKGTEKEERGEGGAYHFHQVFKHTNISHCAENFKVILY